MPSRPAAVRRDEAFCKASREGRKRRKSFPVAVSVVFLHGYAAVAMSTELRYFATAPKGVASVLLTELQELGARDTREAPAGVAFSGALELAYRVCLWSRTANRILLPLTEFEAPDAAALYTGVQTVPWHDHLPPQATLAVDFTGSSHAISHTHFGALKVKDAIVDALRSRYGQRPSIDTRQPGVRVHVHLERERASVSIDLSGSSLHERGYRTEAGAAPLKENLAAALLLRLKWPQIAGQGGALLDPMCGSGTLLIEGALMAGDIAPGLRRAYFGFLGWAGHDARQWAVLVREANERAAAGCQRIPTIIGSDKDGRVLNVAHGNAQRAQLADRLQFFQREVSAARPPSGAAGLVVVNPPYGERLGEGSELELLYASLGRVLREHFVGWKAGVFTGNPPLGKRMGLRARRKYALYNGPLPCELLCFDVEPQWFVTERPRTAQGGPSTSAEHAPAGLGGGAEMFANRLRKNLRSVGKWARQEGIACYRLYDADMPEYAFAIDVYGGTRSWVHVQEYAPPASVDPRDAEQRRRDVLSAVPGVLHVPAEDVFVKVRQRQKAGGQYEKQAGHGELHEVTEGPCRFLVNFTDYLDTGLFLDHRITRQMLAKWAKGQRFLNLFGYTGSATVFAAFGGATATTHVDMSRTYLDWAQRNLALNGFTGPRYEFVQADCLAWLASARSDPRHRCRYGLIFVDPPTFSRSKRMAGTFDVQRDHVAMLHAASELLTPGGRLVFSTNLRSFKLDADGLAPLRVENITAQTIPRDFARNPRIHQCFSITREE